MKKLMHLKKEQQQIMPLFDGALIENKPIPFPRFGTNAYSSLFYWAHAEAINNAEFPLHYHEGFEIMTFVLEGHGEHYDTVSKVWTPLKKGDVQVIQSGSGVEHSERLIKGAKAFQIWFDPDFLEAITKGATYKDYPKDLFKNEKQEGIQRTFYIGDNGVISCITPNIEVEKLSFRNGNYKELLDENYTYSCYLLDGAIKIHNELVTQDSFFVFNSAKEVNFIVEDKAELFVIKSLTDIKYPLFREKYL